MALYWGDAWGSAWGDAWGVAGVEAPAPPPAPNATPGWSAYVREARKRQGRNKPIPEDEELVHPQAPEPIYADAAPSAELVSAEQFAQMLTRPVQQAIERQDIEDRQRAHRRRIAEALALLLA